MSNYNIYWSVIILFLFLESREKKLPIGINCGEVVVPDRIKKPPL